MLDKKQVAVNSILELNEDNVKMKITLTDYERVGFSIFWRINQTRNFFPAKLKNLLVNIFSVTELFKKIQPKSPGKNFFNFDLVIRLVPS